MTFGEVFGNLTAGAKIRRKDWAGYWVWENGTIMMHCENGGVLDIRETYDPLFTFGNIAASDWVIVKSHAKKEDHMGSEEFIGLVKEAVASYVNKHLDKSDDAAINKDDVYIVWLAKVLQNSKALASTTLPDGMYYELTYNGDKGELYLDAYKKFENVCLEVQR